MDPKYVWKNGTGTMKEPFSTIQAAVERASSGDTIFLYGGDYILSKSVVIAEMAELHLRALDASEGIPRLIDWGIQIQATIGMISNITISDMIIESSSGLRVIGTVSDVTIQRVSFLMIGPATEDVIKLDRVKLGGDGTNNASSIHGIKFLDCVFDTRNSVLIDKQNFFSWRQLVSSSSPGSDGITPNNRLTFENTRMKGGSRGELTLYFEDVSSVSFLHSNLSKSALLSSNPTDFTFHSNSFDGSGIYFTGNVSHLEISNNLFKNFGKRNFPTLSHPSSITFRPYLPANAFYSNITISHNNFTNFTSTSSDPVHGYASIFFLPPSSSQFSYDFSNVSINFNDFSHLDDSIPQDFRNDEIIMNFADEEIGVSNEEEEEGTLGTSENSGTSETLETSKSSKSSNSKISSKFAKFSKRNGPLAIYCDSGPIDARFNYYGDENGPSSCCNPEAKASAPRVSPHLQWFPWCTDGLCSENKTVLSEDCYGCSDQFPLMPAKKDDDGTLVLVLIATTLAIIVVIVGLTGLYCFTRPKSLEVYSLVPADGWRSKLLASVPDVQALFDQVGVPLINFHDLILNPIPIGTGSFGRVYDGVLTANASHIQLHRELHTLMDNETLSKSTLSKPTSPKTPLSKTPPKPKKFSFDEDDSSSFQIRYGDEHSTHLSSFHSPTNDKTSEDDTMRDDASDSTRDGDESPSLLMTSNSSSSLLYDDDMHQAPSLMETMGEEKRKKDGKKKSSIGSFFGKFKGKSKDKKGSSGEGEEGEWGEEVEKTREKEKKKSFFGSGKKSKKKDAPRPIAVKELNSNITESYEDMREFLEEIKIMASIDHPNLLKLRGVAIDPITENILLVMDLMDLGSLDDVIFKRKIPMSFARKLAISTEVGYALHYLHSKEPAICHRDLKPGNVLVSKKWNIKVGDFGSSRVLDRKTATLTLKGTPIYLAPESINSSKFSEKSDVYSYGVTLVELFGGMRAFDDIDGSAANLMYRIATEGLRPTIPPNLPNSLKSLIRRCMATDPDDRPNFTDILEKLAEIRAASTDSTSDSDSNPSSLVLESILSSSSTSNGGGGGGGIVGGSVAAASSNSSNPSNSKIGGISGNGVGGSGSGSASASGSGSIQNQQRTSSSTQRSPIPLEDQEFNPRSIEAAANSSSNSNGSSFSGSPSSSSS